VTTPSNRRQRLRKFIITVSALCFPLTMLYFSPGMVFRGARLGIVSGSYITFGLLFLSAILFGRAWCGWLCPVAGFSEWAQIVDNRLYTHDWAKWVKYTIWGVWIIAIALVATLVGGGFSSVDPFLGTHMGVSIHTASLIAAYYLVIAIIFASTWLLGRRGFCHTLCWMAPFMVAGRKFSNLFQGLALRLTHGSEECIDCRKCEAVCPMSLPLSTMVKRRDLESVDCILCGACVDTCPSNQLNLLICSPPDRDNEPIAHQP